ncbi:MAG: carbamoyl phosphate synthase large subunit, partial [Nitrospinales bacterium]
ARDLEKMDYKLLATKGTAEFLTQGGCRVERINKFLEGSPHIVGAINANEVALVLNTTFGEKAVKDSFSLRRASLAKGLPYCTTIPGAFALTNALKRIKKTKLEAKPLQEYRKI